MQSVIYLQVRQMKNELEVEDVIKMRTDTAVHERCRDV